jgi:hypothetical protein
MTDIPRPNPKVIGHISREVVRIYGEPADTAYRNDGSIGKPSRGKTHQSPAGQSAGAFALAIHQRAEDLVGKFSSNAMAATRAWFGDAAEPLRWGLRQTDSE